MGKKFFQIWLDSDLHEDALESMASLRVNMEEGDEYVFISDRQHPEFDHLDVRDYVAEYVSRDSEFTKMWEHFCAAKLTRHFPLGMAKSVFLRSQIMATNPEAVYADCDLILKSLPRFRPEKPYLGANGGLCGDIFLMYANNRCDWFLKVLRNAMRWTVTRGSLYHPINKTFRDFERIPGSHFEHRTKIGFRPKERRAETAPA